MVGFCEGAVVVLEGECCWIQAFRTACAVYAAVK